MEQQHEEWESELERLGGAVRPAGPVGDAVVGRVRRRRARRRTAGVVGGAAAVAAVVVSVSLVGPGGSSSAPPVAVPTSTSTEEPTVTTPASPYVLPLGEGCTHPFLDPLPPYPDAEGQERIAREAEAVRDDRFVVRAAQPSALGVIAMVEGDQAAARSVLTEVGEVFEFTGIVEESYAMALERRVNPVIHQTKRTLADLPGESSTVTWWQAGGLVVQATAPVPAEVLALAGVRDDGVTVWVQPVRFGRTELRDASRIVREAIDPDIFPVNIDPCGDRSGLDVSTGAEIGDVDDASARLTELAGVPVRVEIQAIAKLTG